MFNLIIKFVYCVHYIEGNLLLKSLLIDKVLILTACSNNFNSGGLKQNCTNYLVIRI